ncbi:MAG: CapA family protein [Oscillospiraceae bacterium]|nr:CapA family protein [Oscillospiraceae bacterium]
MSKQTEYIAVILLVLLLAFAGGTARFRPAGAEPRQSASPAETAAPSVTAPAATEPPAEPEPTPTPTPPPTPEPTQAPEYYSLHFVGDCTLACNSYYQGGPLGYDTVVGDDYAYPFAKTIQYFENDDFSFANLEVALTESTAAADKTFLFKTHAEYAQVMSEGSIEFVSLANNHVLDFGQQGYDDTKAAVEAAGIAYAGRDEWTIYQTPRGLKIGVYAVSFGTATQIKNGVRAVREAGADFVIAALHWGDEGSYQINADQLACGHAAVDAGADFVYGSHPHTLQPIERYNGVEIVYSMGNWTFGGNTNPRDKDTLIYGMTLAQYPDGHVEVADTEIIPCASSGVEDGNNFQPVPYVRGSEGYDRVLSKLDGSFEGQNLTISYSYGPNE